MSTRNHVRGAAVAVAIALAAACSGGGGGGGRTVNGIKLSAAEYRYGRAPAPAGNGIAYQPDVVLIGGGPKAVKAESGDGITWTIDGDADGADNLIEGKIMFATERAVGRVLAVSEVNGDKVVILGPVELTDIFDELEFEVTEPIMLDDVVSHVAPALAGGLVDMTPTQDDQGAPSATTTTVPSSTTETSKGVVGMPPISLIATSADADPLPPPPPSQEPVVEGPYEIEPRCCDPYGIAITYRDGGTYVYAVAHVALTVGYVQIKIKGGQVQSARFEVSDAFIAMYFDAASEEGTNVHDIVEVPVEFDLPLLYGPRGKTGVPLTLQMKQTFVLSTAFSAKDTTLKGSGRWELDGPLGFSYASGKFKPLLANVTTTKSLLKSLEGHSVGITSLIWGSSFHATVGLGSHLLSTGLGTKATVVVTGLRQSDVVLLPCRAATLNIVEGFGIGWTIPDRQLEALNKALRKKGITKPVEKEPERLSGIPVPLTKKASDQRKGCAGL